jgi:two-component system LytT family sensor kinase
MLFFAFVFEESVSSTYLARIVTVIGTGFISTHLLREFIKKMNWFLLPIEKILPKLIIVVIVTTFVSVLFQMSVYQIFNLDENKRKLDFVTRMLSNLLNSGIFVLPWTLIY